MDSILIYSILELAKFFLDMLSLQILIKLIVECILFSALGSCWIRWCFRFHGDCVGFAMMLDGWQLVIVYKEFIIISIDHIQLN